MKIKPNGWMVASVRKCLSMFRILITEKLDGGLEG